jgi:hypothetical protein
MNGHNSHRSVTLLYMGIPPSKNVLRRKYRSPHAYKKLRDGWQRHSWGLVQGPDRAWLLSMAALGKRMRIDATLMHTRLYDTTNAHGSLDPVIDGLVNLGFLADDDVKHLDLHVTQQKIRADQTVLVIREAEELFPDVLSEDQK